MLHVFSRRNLDTKGLDAERPLPPLFKRFALRPWWTETTGAREELRRLVMRALGLGAKRLRRTDNGDVIGPEALFSPVLEHWMETTARERGITYEEQFGEHVQSMALRRIATEDEVANAVLFFASDMSSGITGATLDVNAGQLFG